tara:strand:- start:514 stop:1020 length:507 start_codon:yes stop_codon:yes gene_type:complete
MDDKSTALFGLFAARCDADLAQGSVSAPRQTEVGHLVRTKLRHLDGPAAGADSALRLLTLRPAGPERTGSAKSILTIGLQAFCREYYRSLPRAPLMEEIEHRSVSTHGTISIDGVALPTVEMHSPSATGGAARYYDRFVLWVSNDESERPTAIEMDDFELFIRGHRAS